LKTNPRGSERSTAPARANEARVKQMTRAGQNPMATEKDLDLAKNTVAPGDELTTNQGLVISDDNNQLKAGVRGPSLLEDFHFREKIQHFDHERIPERVVHARGFAAHGYFECTNPMPKITKASLFAKRGKQTPVFLRFSTVAGSRGSADTPRDVRGFAVKFYTDQGVWDMVGNNIPIFFIQDAIKFPDLIHAVKPEPHNEIPQAASAHDTFYDFASLTPELTHMLLWVMSDRALPRSFAMMEGFGIHTFRFINAAGQSTFVKFHFKPAKGVHSLVWDESQKIAGKDPDFHRRDLFDAIKKGDFPQWTFGVQMVPEADEHKFDFDLLDPTKIIPEELVPVTPIGKLVLNRNVENYFAETEQVAFHPGHVVPGIDFSNDPLLQGRLFSYLDTQLKRVGPNFAQLPINRPSCPFSNNQRDGQSQQMIHSGRVAYFPNTLANGCPAHSPEGMNAFRSYAEQMQGPKVRLRSDTFSDHFSQATLFWNSMAQWEKNHIVDALSFELNMVETVAIKQRIINDLLVNVADELATRVAGNIDVKVTATPKVKPHDKTSPALSMDKPALSIKGRKVAVLAGDGVNAKQLKEIKAALESQQAIVDVIAKRAGSIKGDDGSSIAVAMPAPNAPSVKYDAVFIPSGKHVAALLTMGLAVHFVAEAYTHCKPILAIGEAVELLKKAQVPVAPDTAKLAEQLGVVTAPSSAKNGPVVTAFTDAMLKHRHFDREIESVPA
jgi:catalase